MKRVLVFLCACSGSPPPAPEEMAPAIVTCGTGTMLVNGVCEATPAQMQMQPDPVTCAAGTTFDSGSNSCSADITGCGPTTQAVDGVCVPLTRISVALLAGPSGALDWYAVPFTSYVLQAQAPTGPVPGAVLLGSTQGHYSSSAMQTVALVPGDTYLIEATLAGDPLNVTNVLPKVPYLPLNFAFFPNAVSGPGVQVFHPEAGEQYLVYTQDQSVPMHIPVPNDPIASGDSVVTFAYAFPSAGQRFAVGLLRDGGEDPLAVDLYLTNMARTHEVALRPGDAMTFHLRENGIAGQYYASLIAPEGADALAPDTRYLCVLGNDEGDTICLDGEAHAASPTSAGFKHLTNANDQVATTVVNTASVPISLVQGSATQAAGFLYFNDLMSPLQSSPSALLPEAELTFQLVDSTGAVLATSPLTTPVATNQPTFAYVSVEPELRLVPEYTGGADLHYTFVNAGTGPTMNVSISANDADGIARGGFGGFDIATVNCGSDVHELQVTWAGQLGRCTTLDACDYDQSGHVLVRVSPSGITVFELGGASHTYPAPGVCI